RESGGPDDGGVSSPTQDGAFDFFEAAEDHAEASAAAGQLDQFLAAVPAAATDEVAAIGVELNYDFVIMIAFHDAEAASKVFLGIEFSRAREALASEFRIGEA